MTYKLNFFYIALIIAALLTACSGEDGDPGPKGEQGEQGDAGEKGLTGKNGTFKLGYFEGTVTGIRQDGTSFSEPFSFEYANDSLNAFSESGGVKYISFYRSGHGGSFGVRLKLTEGGDIVADSSSNYSFAFHYKQILDNDSIFKIEARPSFYNSSAYVLTLSRENQQSYNFHTQSDSNPYHSINYYSGTDKEEHMFLCISGWKYYRAFYSFSDGNLLALHDWETGEYLTEGELFDKYNELKFMNNADLGTPVFYDAASGEGLYEEIPATPSDEISITNYERNETTGVMTFDYELKISQYGVYSRQNSTFHDLTISGSFNSGNRIYTNTISRVGE